MFPARSLGGLYVYEFATRKVTRIALRATADGELRAAFGVPDGTPGRAQFNLAERTPTGSGGLEDGVSVDQIRLQTR